MGALKYLVIHCTATPEGRNLTAQDIIRMHTAPVSQGGRGWSRVGYSDMIDLNGRLINLRPYNENDIVEDNEFTNGALGLNREARHVVYVGGVDKAGNPKDTRTEAQKATLADYVKKFHKLHPQAVILGHRDIPGVHKACPSFDVRSWLKEIGL